VAPHLVKNVQDIDVIRFGWNVFADRFGQAAVDEAASLMFMKYALSCFVDNTLKSIHTQR
jgi:hypothetical protein